MGFASRVLDSGRVQLGQIVAAFCCGGLLAATVLWLFWSCMGMQKLDAGLLPGCESMSGHANSVGWGEAVALHKMQVLPAQAAYQAELILRSPLLSSNDGPLNGEAFGATEGIVVQFSAWGAGTAWAHPDLAPYRPLWELLRDLACPYCNAWVVNPLISPPGRNVSAGSWHFDQTFDLQNKPGGPQEERTEIVPAKVSVLYLTMPRRGGGLSVETHSTEGGDAVDTFLDVLPAAGDVVVFDGRLAHAILPFKDEDVLGPRQPRTSFVVEHYQLRLDSLHSHVLMPQGA